MSKQQQSDTDLIEAFQENLETLKVLFGRIEILFRDNKNDPIVQAKLKSLKNELLVDDIKLQDAKIKKINNVLEIFSCSQKVSSKS